MDISSSNESKSKSINKNQANDNSLQGETSFKKQHSEIDKENNDKFSDNEANKSPTNDIVVSKIPLNDEIKDNHGNSSEDSENEAEISKNSQIPNIVIPKFDQNDNIYEFYEFLRKEYAEKKICWEDPEFSPEISQLYKDPNNMPEKFKHLTFEFVRPEEMNPDEHDNLKFYYFNNSSNINYQYNIKRGILNDKFFISAVLMLFKKKEEFFSNLVLDIENVDKNLQAGFVGFTFFINGSWKNVTVDTRIPWHQTNDVTLSTVEAGKPSYWLTLFQKAYSKIHKTYDILNDVSIKNLLVDLTGGTSKKIRVKENIDDTEKKVLYEEMKRCIQQNYIMGCMKYVEKGDDDLDESKSDQGDDEEEIITNSMYVILDIQEHESNGLIYLVNYWNKGKWNKAFGPEDEQWETIKGLKEKLGYENTSDGTFWMQFDDWVSNFNTLYYCRIYPQNWSQYCISGAWEGIYSGGAPPKGNNIFTEKSNQADKTIAPKKSTFISTNANKKVSIINPGLSSTIAPKMNVNGLTGAEVFNFKKTDFNQTGMKITLNQLKSTNTLDEGPMSPMKNSKLGKTSFNKTVNFKKTQLVKEPENHSKEFMRRIILNDSEDRWFLNPQYKIEVKYQTKLIITLLQEDEKLSKKNYQKCNFLIIISKNKYSRIWDIKDEHIIKKAVELDDKPCREIIVNLEYWELEKKYKQLTKKKNVSKTDIIYLNVIPYIEYYVKYEIEKMNNNRIFKLIKLENNFWLRIFASDEIVMNELPKPHEKSLELDWNASSSGGARYIKDSKNHLVENSNWPLNPQYLLVFENSLHMKIILRKTIGHLSNEESRVGFILTKPYLNENPNYTKATKTKGAVNKKDQMQRILDSTNKILENRKINYEHLMRKQSFHTNEFVEESSYSNNYCASLYRYFNKIDSPLMIIPTLDKADVTYGFKLAIYSNKPVELISLNSDTSQVLISEWTLKNCGGCHLIIDDKKKNKEEESNIKKISWHDNPKFHLWFESKVKIPELEFDVVISRLDNIWQKVIAKGIVNAMMGMYLFKYDKEKWKDYPINLKDVNFIPKNELTFSFKFSNIDPRGFLLMPATYGSGVAGPFSIMVKCKEKFTLEPFGQKAKSYD